MEMFWRTKGKRIAAWLMIALIMATTIPFGSIRASADNTATGESGTVAVAITGQVMVPGNDDENTDTNNGNPYAGAKVTVTYPQSGSTPVTNEATTTDDGKFNISIGDWTLNTDNKYTVKVEPADVDKGTYDSYSSEEKTVTEDQVKTLLELQTIQKKMYDPVVAEGNITVSDDEANQTTFTYVSISTSGDDITDEEKETKKEQAQEILDKMKEDPTADMSEIASGVDESYSAVQGNFTTKESEDEDEDSSSSAYPEEVLTVLRGLKEGEVADDIIETDTGYYVVRLDKINDEDATASKRESLQNSKESTYYTETTDKWVDDADITVNKKVLKTLKIGRAHV